MARQEQESTQLIEEVKHEVSNQHRITGITTNLIIELKQGQQMPTGAFIEKLLLSYDNGAPSLN